MVPTLGARSYELKLPEVDEEVALEAVEAVEDPVVEEAAAAASEEEAEVVLEEEDLIATAEADEKVVVEVEDLAAGTLADEAIAMVAVMEEAQGEVPEGSAAAEDSVPGHLTQDRGARFITKYKVL